MRLNIRPRLIGITESFMHELNSDIAKVFVDAASDSSQTKGFGSRADPE